MDGITILNEITKTIEPTPIGVWYIFLIAAISCTILVVLGIAIGIKTKDSAGIGLGVLLGFIVVPLWFLVIAIHEDTQREAYITTQYEVTISDEVSLKEFNEKYKIIEQRDQLYVIQERESNE